MGDLETFILVGTALAGLGAVVQHFYDRFAPRGLYLRSSRLAADLPTRIGSEVENALERVGARQKALYEEAAKAAMESEAKDVVALKRAGMSMVRGVGVDRQMQAQVSKALSEAILGPALPILRQFAPGLADALEENPQLVDVVIQNPLFKKYIEPRIAQFLGTQTKPADMGNPLLGELGR